IEKFFPKETQFIQRGVLDGITEERILQLQPETGQTTLVSRMKNGDSVKMGKEKILPIIQNIIDSFNNENLNLIIIACTGEFKPFHSEIPVIYPDYLANHAVQGLFREKGTIGVI